MPDKNWAKVVIVLPLIWVCQDIIWFFCLLCNEPSVYEAAKWMDAISDRLFWITMHCWSDNFLDGIMALNNTRRLFGSCQFNKWDPVMQREQYRIYIWFILCLCTSYGYAAAVSYVVLILIIILTIVQKGMTGEKKWENTQFGKTFLILFSFICIFQLYWMIVSATNMNQRYYDEIIFRRCVDENIMTTLQIQTLCMHFEFGIFGDCNYCIVTFNLFCCGICFVIYSDE